MIWFTHHTTAHDKLSFFPQIERVRSPNVWLIYLVSKFTATWFYFPRFRGRAGCWQPQVNGFIKVMQVKNFKCQWIPQSRQICGEKYFTSIKAVCNLTAHHMVHQFHQTPCSPSTIQFSDKSAAGVSNSSIGPSAIKRPHCVPTKTGQTTGQETRQKSHPRPHSTNLSVRPC